MPSRVLRFGLEAEGWMGSVNVSGYGRTEHLNGQLKVDAGLHHLEVVTDPLPSLDKALDVWQALLGVSNGDRIEFTAFRPFWLAATYGVWQPKKRYEALLAALRRERPSGWQGVNAMTNNASIQLNVDGDFDPDGDDGVLLINVFNKLSHFLAARIHAETSNGKGHLSIWRDFALPERLPQYGRWISGPRALAHLIESLPQLLRRECEEDEDSEIVVGDDSVLQDATKPLDRGTIWWHWRPKIGKSGKYGELRYFPSMPPAVAAPYLREAIGMIETLLEWFHGDNHGQPVASPERGEAAIDALAEEFPFLRDRVPVGMTEAAAWQLFMMKY